MLINYKFSRIFCKLLYLLKFFLFFKEFFPAGARIVKQGEIGDKFYIISGGNVRITKDADHGEEELVVLGKGQYFGEKALYDVEGQHKRHANVTALVPVECLTLDRTLVIRILYFLK